MNDRLEKNVLVESLLQQAHNVIDQPPGSDINVRTLIVIDDQMIEAENDNRIVNLFIKESHHQNLSRREYILLLSVNYIVQNLFHLGKGNRSISLNRHYLVLFKNSREN